MVAFKRSDPLKIWNPVYRLDRNSVEYNGKTNDEIIMIAPVGVI